MSGMIKWTKQRGNEDVSDGEKTLMLKLLFANEMSADYFGMYIRKKNGKNHVYKSSFGAEIPNDIENVLDALWTRLKDLDTKRIICTYDPSSSLYTTNLFMEAQRVTASLGTTWDTGVDAISKTEREKGKGKRG